MNIALVLITKFPGTEWGLDGETYSDLIWFDKSPKPTEDELLALWPDVEYEASYNSVNQIRALAYAAPGGSDGIFFQYQRGEKTEQDWLDAVQAINDANPYPVKAK